MTSLLVVSSSRGALQGDELHLDVKFVEGMRLYSRLWDGQVGCLLKLSDQVPPFSRSYDVSDLPFKITTVPAISPIDADAILGWDIILCAADDHTQLQLGPQLMGTAQKVVYCIENIPDTRWRIILREPSLTLTAKLRSLAWEILQEPKRKRALRSAAGVQVNGFPAFERYRSLNASSILYLDSRLGDALIATEEEMAARRRYLESEGPLRIIHSGRLEPLKGSNHLVDVALHMHNLQLDFVLNVFGEGSLKEELVRRCKERGLEKVVLFHGAVDFEKELVPFARREADVYLSLHNQSDPSCTYLESMGCGLAVVGYENRMSRELIKRSRGGWTVPVDEPLAAAQKLRSARYSASSLIVKCQNALEYARGHAFESEFGRRIEHLQSLLSVEPS